MKIERKNEENSIILEVSGELTSVTSSQLNTSIKNVINETNCLILDLKEIEYLASAGLRVILETKNNMDAKNGKFIIRNVPENVMNIFEITGFNDIIDIE